MARRRPYGTTITKHGVRITKSEKETFQRLVRQANQRARTLRSKIGAFEGLTKKADIRKAVPINQYTFEIQVKSQALNQFQSKREFQQMVTRLRQQVSGRLIERRFRTTKEAYKKSIRENFGSRGNKLIRKINQIPDKDFYLAVKNQKVESVGFIYFDRQEDKLNLIDAQLEMLLE